MRGPAHATPQGGLFRKRPIARLLCTCGRAVGAVIEVIVDADEGSLSFRINYGPALPALQGFPRGALLRPYARLFYREGDRVTVTPGCLTS